MATAADIRAWARDPANDIDGADDIPERGRVPQWLTDAYEAAHPGDPAADSGEDAAAGPPAGDGHYDGGVTAADFPPDPDGEPETPQERRKTERAPRNVKTAPAAPRFWRSIRGKGKTSGKSKSQSRARSKPDKPRVPLTDLLEDAWGQLAWAAQGIPPLSRVFAVQAPFAGVVLEPAIKDTLLDKVMQPVARTEHLGRVITGMAGPPVCVAAAMAVGQEHPSFPMIMGMLRYSMLSMAKITNVSAQEALERAETNAQLGREVDQLIAWIFGMAPPPPDMGGPPADADIVDGEVIDDDTARAAAEDDAIRRAQQVFGPAGMAGNAD